MPSTPRRHATTFASWRQALVRRPSRRPGWSCQPADVTMPKTRSGPPIVPVIHRSLVTGLLMLTGVMVLLKPGGLEASADIRLAGDLLSALSFVLLAVALLFLKP